MACAVVREDPPQVFLAEDIGTLNWVLALKLISRMPGLDGKLPRPCSGPLWLSPALLDGQWGDAVSLWMRVRPGEVDVFPSMIFRASP